MIRREDLITMGLDPTAFPFQALLGGECATIAPRNPKLADMVSQPMYIATLAKLQPRAAARSSNVTACFARTLKST